MNTPPLTLRERRRLWEQAQTELTAKQYEAVMLHYLGGMPTSAIALHLGISRQAVQARLVGGRRRLLRSVFPPNQEAA